MNNGTKTCVICGAALAFIFASGRFSSSVCKKCDYGDYPHTNENIPQPIAFGIFSSLASGASLSGSVLGASYHNLYDL
jgi:hypothetical protein